MTGIDWFRRCSPPLCTLNVEGLRPPNSPGREVWLRMAAQWPLKFFGITAFITVFFFAYFTLLRFPLFGVTLMPATRLDQLIPYHPSALPIYFSLWFYVSLAPALLRSRVQLLFHAKVAGLMAIAGLTVFFFWPTAAPTMAGLSEADAAGLAWLKQVDSAGNACPSLHVAFAVFSGLWLHRTLGEIGLPTVVRVLNLVWGGAIVYSTLATKQHVVVDVLAGVVLGLIAGLRETREMTPVLAPVRANP